MVVPLYTKFLDGRLFGQDTKDIVVKDKYLWSKLKFKLPIKVSFDVMIMHNPSAILPVFAKEKIEWNGKNTDALTWHLATDRDDFTFRTNMFGDFPDGK